MTYRQQERAAIAAVIAFFALALICLGTWSYCTQHHHETRVENGCVVDRDIWSWDGHVRSESRVCP